MTIEVRWWDGKGDPEDPKVGTPGAANLDVLTALRGKAVSGVGGITPGTDSIAFNFNNEAAALWFTTAGSGTPRLLIRRK